MATALASRSSYAPSQLAHSYRQPVAANTSYNGTVFASPTDSEFSEFQEDQEDVGRWDEARVAQWLRNMHAEAYIGLFHEHNISGENLLDLDQAALKEMGVRKIGDRVRIASQIKQLMQREFRGKRSNNGGDTRTFDNSLHTPPSSGSPRAVQVIRAAVQNERLPQTRPCTAMELQHAPSIQQGPSKSTSMPTSPHNASSEGGRTPRYAGRSPREVQAPSYFSIASMQSGAAEVSVPIRQGPLSPPSGAGSEVIQGRARASSWGRDNYALLGGQLPADKPLIRVIFDQGSSSIFAVDNCKTAEEVITKALRKGKLNEAHVKNHCLWVLNGIDADSNQCRKLTDTEIMRICNDSARVERERLMLRKIHAGEPEGDQLKAAANVAVQQMEHSQYAAASIVPARSRDKLEKVTGEALPSLSYPMSPASAAERERHLHTSAHDLLTGPNARAPAPRPRPARVKEFPAGRPPSELVCADFVTYFPDVKKDEIERTVQNSIRRSQRLSRATNRMSIASSITQHSGMYDPPPLPAIADTWFNGADPPNRFRPLSVARRNVLSVNYRDSLASALEPLEESPLEPNRRSYVSFGTGSAPDSASASTTEREGLQRSYSDDAASFSPSFNESAGSFNEQLSQAIAEDGEEPDSELTEFLNTDSWENVKYLRGKLIGQGSFGSVYLALHAVTGELMAVKQVEMPNSASTINNPALDAKKNTMVEALKREISLLKDLKHPNIVQYFGSSSEASTLNIFLEYIPGGSIAKMLVDYGSLNEALVSNFVQQTLVGLAYLHSKDIIHRDIKGANILVDNHGQVKISDFGISKRVQDSKSLLSSSVPVPIATTTTSNTIPRRPIPAPAAGLANPANRVSLQGSVFWMAPEVVRQTAYTRKADIWSLGCLIVEMVTGSHPHPSCSQLQALFKIGGGVDPVPDVPAGASVELRAFLKTTFEVDFEKRPEAEVLLGMPFLRSFPATVGSGL